MFRRDRKPPCFGWLARTAPSQGRRRPTVAYRAQRPSHVKSWNHDREYTWVTAESLTRTGMSPPREIMLDIAAKLATLFLGLAPPDIRRSQAQEESRELSRDVKHNFAWWTHSCTSQALGRDPCIFAVVIP